MYPPELFTCASIHEHPRGAAVTRIISSAFNSVHAGAAVKNYLRAHPLPAAKRAFALGLGKAAPAMTSALADLIPLNDRLIVTKHAPPSVPRNASVILGNHPIPGEESLAAGRAALKFVSQLTPDDLLVCLISGGGSALMAAPIIPLDELQKLTSTLLANGARIDQINTLRRHLDSLKGGGLAQAANGAQIVSLILSDVVGDSLEAIASGPTAPDPTTKEDALNVMRHAASATYEFRETLKPDDALFNNVQNQIVGSNDLALLAAKKQAEDEGFYAEIVYSGLQGEAREIGKHLAQKLKDAEQKYPRPLCLLAGGETTVTLKGSFDKAQEGKGGRNQELVLSAVNELRGMQDVMFISIATDGEDGVTDAAGAVATEESARRAAALGLDNQIFLKENNAHPFFDALGDLLQPGPSGTNVNDIILLFAF
jgi:hydroxypyruvate reductase